MRHPLKSISALVSILLFAACTQTDTSEWVAISSSSLQILEAGAAAPAGCIEKGSVAIHESEPGFLSRQSGFAIEKFHTALRAELEPLDANLLIPSTGSDLEAASSSGQAFHAVAYSCP